MTAILMPNGKQAYTNGIGAPLADGKVYTYAATTTTPKATYTDASGATPNANPVILDARGEASIFWNGSYKVTLKDASDNLIWTQDNLAATDLLSTLAASSGSSLVGFIQAGAGAVARTAQAKMRETVSAKDYGATGDGATVDTAALQAAIDQAVTTGLNKLHIPTGTYITRQLTLPSNFTITGEGGRSSLLKRDPAWTGANNVILQVGGTAADISRVTIEDLAFDLNGAGEFGRIIQLGQQDVTGTIRTVSGVRIRNCDLRDSAPVHPGGDKWAILWRANLEDVWIEDNYCNGEMQLCAGGSDIYRNVHICRNRLLTGYANGIAMSAGRDNHVVEGLWICDNYIEATALSIFIGPDAIYAANTGGTWKDWHITGNTCLTRTGGSQTTWMGIYITATQASFRRGVVSGNIVDNRDAVNSQVGIRFDDALSYGTVVEDFACDGNVVSNCRWGIQGTAIGKSSFTGNALSECSDGFDIIKATGKVAITGGSIVGGSRAIQVKRGEVTITGVSAPGGATQSGSTTGRLNLIPGATETARVKATGCDFSDTTAGTANNYGVYGTGAGTFELYLYGNDISDTDMAVQGVTPIRAEGNIGYALVRGALVKKAADQVGVDFTGGTVVSWDAEAYDNSGWHDNVTNNSRLTVPADVFFVEVGATVTVGNGTAGADMTLAVRKNGLTSFDGTAVQTADAIAATANINVTTGPVAVVPGDYFEVAFFYTVDASIDITAARSNFWIKAVG